MKGIKAKTAV